MGDERADFETRTSELAGGFSPPPLKAPASEVADEPELELRDTPLEIWARAADARLAELDRRLAAVESAPTSNAHEAAAAELHELRGRLALVAAVLVEREPHTLELIARLVGG